MLGKEYNKLRLDEITAERIVAFRQEHLEAGKEPSTVNRYLAVLRLILRTAVNLEKLERSPFEGRRIRLAREQGRTRIVTFTEEHRYLKAANATLRDIAVLLIESGLRPTELFRLRQGDVSLRNRQVIVRASKTENGECAVPLSEAALEVLKRRVADAKGAYLFPYCNRHRYDWNLPMVTIQKAHEEALKHAKIAPPFRLYDLRHTYATRAIEAGIDVLTLRELMGHSDLQMTSKYVSLSQRHLTEATTKQEQHRAARMIAEFAGNQTTATPQ